MVSKMALDHFQAPRNMGRLEGANAEAEDENPVCGDRLHLCLRIENQKIQEVAWQGEGCAAAIAAASAMSEALRGLDLKTARALGREDIAEALGGLPARKTHVSMLAISTLQKALASYPSGPPHPPRSAQG